MENTQQTGGNGKALAKKGAAGVAAKGQVDNFEMFRGFGFEKPEIAALKVQTLATGGIAKWVDLSAFQRDPKAVTCKPDEVTGAFIAGYLTGRHEIPDERSEEIGKEGEPVRHYYTIELVQPCPVTYKDGEEKKVEIAQPGEIVNLGERFHLKPLRPYAEAVANGGRYAIGVKPFDKRPIGGGQTMWSFQIQQIEVQPPRIYTAETTATTSKKDNPF